MRRFLLLTMAACCVALAAAASAPQDSAATMAALGTVTAARYPLAEAVVVYDRQREEYTAAGTSVLERARLVKVLAPGAVRDFAQLRITYAPQYNRAEFLWARLIKPDGRSIPLPVDSLDDVPRPASLGGTIFWGERDKVLDVPGLAPGDAVEYATRELGGLWLGPGSLADSLFLLGTLATPYRGHFNRVVMFQSDDPAIEVEYTLAGPRALPPAFAVYNGELEHRDLSDSFRCSHLWRGRNLPAIVREPRMPSSYDVGRKLIVTTIPSWEWMSRYEHALADSCLRPDRAIRDKAEELCAGRPDALSRIRALSYYVAGGIRYLGLTAGEDEGYKPHPARMTFDQKAGVCKDKAALLVALLDAAGFRAWYAVTAAGHRMEAIPADQANHAIVAVDDGRGGFVYCDPTMADGSAELLPAHARGQQVSIARPDGDGLRTISLLPADSNRLEIDNQCRLDTAGNLSGVIILRGTGAQDTWLRRMFEWRPRSRREGVARDIVRQLDPSAEVVAFDHADPDSLWQPMVCRIEYAVPGAAFSAGPYRILKPGLARYEPWWIDPSRTAESAHRTHAVDLGANFSAVLRERIELPAGWAAVSQPPRRKGSYRTGSWSAEAAVGRGAVAYSRRLTADNPHIAAGDYPSYRRSMLGYLDARDGWFVLQPARP